jgi:ABC-type sugar transport system ATPase subunit
MRGIRKSFGPVEVLHGVDLTVRPGEVHVLAGENGAGKSTLIRILSGVYRDFGGSVELSGREVRFARPADAARAGIATIHQELALVPDLDVADNLFLGRELRGPLGGVDFRAQRRVAAEVLAELGLEVEPGTPVGALPIATRQMIEIARALRDEAKVFIFDEPTSALGEREVEVLFGRIRELRGRGAGILYITHRMEEIFRLADRITVLRDGSLVGTADAADLPPDELIRWMVGRDLEVAGPSESHVRLEVALAVEDLTVRRDDGSGLPVVDRVSLQLLRGEIVGLAGLQGSGASEVLQALFGALGRRAWGSVELGGAPFRMESPAASIRSGMVLLSNDRKALGLAPEAGVRESMSLASLERFADPFGWIRRLEERNEAAEFVREFRISAPSLDAPVRTLSGGNQQKVLLARCLMTRPDVLLLDEPTRGIDVGAKADLYALMREWTADGAAILLITSEMDELLNLADRILVMHRGRIAASFLGRGARRDAILAAAMGHDMDGPPLDTR